MASVTARINKIKQPRGGYIKPSTMKEIILDDGVVLNEKENLHGRVVGLVVDYMTRFMNTGDAEEAFSIPLLGAAIAEDSGVKGKVDEAIGYFWGIKGVDDDSIINACKLVSFDAWRRNPVYMILMNEIGGNKESIENYIPDSPTIENIRTFINRSLHFIEEYGPITVDGFGFLPENCTKEQTEEWKNSDKEIPLGGYTHLVDSGDGDFLTADTLWDFKVTRSNPTSKHTMQLLMYWIMGKHSKKECFKNINKIGIFNPRKNIVYLYNTDDIPEKTIDVIEKEVFNYY